jgi:hypothetical protein
LSKYVSSFVFRRMRTSEALLSSYLFKSRRLNKIFNEGSLIEMRERLHVTPKLTFSVTVLPDQKPTSFSLVCYLRPTGSMYKLLVWFPNGIADAKKKGAGTQNIKRGFQMHGWGRQRDDNGDFQDEGRDKGVFQLEWLKKGRSLLSRTTERLFRESRKSPRLRSFWYVVPDCVVDPNERVPPLLSLPDWKNSRSTGPRAGRIDK